MFLLQFCRYPSNRAEFRPKNSQFILYFGRFTVNWLTFRQNWTSYAENRTNCAFSVHNEIDWWRINGNFGSMVLVVFEISTISADSRRNAVTLSLNLANEYDIRLVFGEI